MEEYPFGKHKSEDLLLVFVLASLGWLIVTIQGGSDLNHLGGEYFNVAQSVRSGAGFSNPFGVETGPTAWTPPGYVYLLVLTLTITGDELGQVISIMRIANVVSFVVLATTILRWSRHLLVPRVGQSAVLLIFLWNFYYFFELTSDVWLRTILCCVAWESFVQTGRQESVASNVTLGFVGGVCFLCCPITGMGWLVTLLIQAWPTFTKFWSKRRLLAIQFGIPLVIAGIIVMPWVIRNRMVMKNWIPIKSNLGYEAFQSQVLDNDGVLDAPTLSRHPWNHSSNQFLRYAELGEVEFVRQCWMPYFNSIGNRPMNFLIRVNNRFVESCISPTYTRNPKLLSTCLLCGTLFSFILLSFCKPKGKELRVLFTLYIVCLAPHVLFGYSERYGASLLLFRALLILFAASRIKGFFETSARKASKIFK